MKFTHSVLHLKTAFCVDYIEEWASMEMAYWLTTGRAFSERTKCFQTERDVNMTTKTFCSTEKLWGGQWARFWRWQPFTRGTRRNASTHRIRETSYRPSRLDFSHVTFTSCFSFYFFFLISPKVSFTSHWIEWQFKFLYRIILLVLSARNITRKKITKHKNVYIYHNLDHNV